MKINGFTVMEIMVGFVLTSIVITTAYFGIEIVMKTKTNIDTEQNTIKKQAALFAVVSRDFFEAKTVIGNKNEFVISTKNNKLKYYLEDTLIIRESSKNDTLFQGEYNKSIVFLKENQIERLILTIETTPSYFNNSYDLKSKIDLGH